jgi:hypothetical protein
MPWLRMTLFWLKVPKIVWVTIPETESVVTGEGVEEEKGVRVYDGVVKLVVCVWGSREAFCDKVVAGAVCVCVVIVWL